MPLHEVAADAIGQAYRALEVDGVPDGQSTKSRTGEGLLHDIGGEGLPAALGKPAGDGQADPVDRNGRALADVLEHPGRADDEPSCGRARLNGRDDAEFLDDAGEHSWRSPLRRHHVRDKG